MKSRGEQEGILLSASNHRGTNPLTRMYVCTCAVIPGCCCLYRSQCRSGDRTAVTAWTWDAVQNTSSSRQMSMGRWPILSDDNEYVKSFKISCVWMENWKSIQESDCSQMCENLPRPNTSPFNSSSVIQNLMRITSLQKALPAELLPFGHCNELYWFKTLPLCPVCLGNYVGK